ncbi:MAG: hypothetical protein K6T85_17365 [Gorillibacterium sp.]|nr:hypothetical protein [Gorillibacterium sp.]
MNDLRQKAARCLCMILILVFCVTGLEFPSQAADLTAKWQFAGSSYHTVALRDNGEVWSWGNNNAERLGLPSLEYAELPKQVLIKNVKQISSLFNTTLALKTDGTVWGWGANTSYQLGTKNFSGEFTGINKPTPINGLKGMIAVATGLLHSLALKSDGTVWAWGRNNEGQLGLGRHSVNSYADNRSAVPTQIKSLKNIVSIAAGGLFSVALDRNGDVWVWGNMVTDGTLVIPPSDVPKKVSGLSSVKQISAGPYHLLALKKDGTVWGIGSSIEGQLGDGVVNRGSKIPKQAANLTDVIMVSAGVDYSVALKQDGTVWGWGDNEDGQLGVDWSRTTLKPTQADGLANIRSIDAVYTRTYVVRSDGSVWAMGTNSDGLLANGMHKNTNDPVQPKLPGQVAVKPDEMKIVKPIDIRIDDNTIDFSGSTAFVNEQGAIMVPASIIKQQMGVSMIWIPKTSTALFQYKSRMFRFSVGDSRLDISDGTTISLDSKPAVIDNQLYIPFSFFAEMISSFGILAKEKGEEYGLMYTGRTSFLDSTDYAGLDFWGRKLRTTNLPKNSADYPYILQDIPNAMYEKPLQSRVKSDLRTPSEFYSYYSFNKKSDVDAWLKHIVDCYDLLLNVDYKANNQGWATKLFNVRSQGVNKAGAIKDNQAYLDWVKKNEIQIEGSIVPQPSMIFFSTGNTKVRSKVRFKLKHYKEYKDVVNDPYFKSGQKLKQGVWYEAYVDIPIDSNVYGGRDSRMYVSIDASLFKDEGVFTKFTEVK